MKKEKKPTPLWFKILFGFGLFYWLAVPSAPKKPITPKKPAVEKKLTIEEKEELAEKQAEKALRSRLFDVRVKCASLLLSKFKVHKVTWVRFKPLFLDKGIRQSYDVINKKNGMKAVFTCQENAKTGRVSVRMQQ